MPLHAVNEIKMLKIEFARALHMAQIEPLLHIAFTSLSRDADQGVAWVKCQLHKDCKRHSS